MNTDEILERILKESKSHFLPIVDYFKGGKGDFLEKVVRLRKPKQVLEIGTLVGYSGIKIMRNLSDSRLITLEINPKMAEVAQKNFEEAGMSERIEIITGDAIKTIPTLKGKFDFVFIDADKEQYLTYLQLLEKNKLLQAKAVILADNVKMFADSMQDYLNYVRNSGKYKSSYYDFGQDGMEESELL